MGVQMQFLLPFNYGKVEVNEQATNDFVSVLTDDDEYQNLAYGGTINVNECSDGIFGRFRLPAGLREDFADTWEFTTDEDMLLVYSDYENAYIVTDDAGVPLRCGKNLFEFIKTI